MVKSINEPGKYTFEGMAPGSVNEPVSVPAGVRAPQITALAPPGGNVSVTSTIYRDRQRVSSTKAWCSSTRSRAPPRSTPDGRLSVTWKPMGVQTAKFRVRNGATRRTARIFL